MIYLLEPDGLEALAALWPELTEADQVYQTRHWQPRLDTVPVRQAGYNPEIAAAVLARWQRVLRAEGLHRLALAAASEDPEVYNYLAVFIRACRRDGPALFNYMQRKEVYPLRCLEREVQREVHRFLGLLRFSCSKEGVYYAPYEPEHDISRFIAPHFAGRMGEARFIIHDLRREKAVLYEQGQLRLQPLPRTFSDFWQAEDASFVRAWQRYYQQAAVTNRLNPQLRRKNMPKKYWAYLSELWGAAPDA
ncbi:MAG: TIGR03915 family putative DNA repair protein [Oscillospiraceae bacterium]|nr:TIGR03915 family putative DNA repair protein [Oscillospiraceae bacterium]MDD4369174.1 TIGR03915 family putative DNA repair protein [Oscillospiraceae bacterium]